MPRKLRNLYAALEQLTEAYRDHQSKWQRFSVLKLYKIASQKAKILEVLCLKLLTYVDTDV
jgi:hypothetical protein